MMTTLLLLCLKYFYCYTLKLLSIIPNFHHRKKWINYSSLKVTQFDLKGRKGLCSTVFIVLSDDTISNEKIRMNCVVTNNLHAHVSWEFYFCFCW